MDINTWRGIATILVMLAFLGVCWWAFSPKRKQGFRDAAQLPFADEELQQNKSKKESKTKSEQESKTTSEHDKGE